MSQRVLEAAKTATTLVTAAQRLIDALTLLAWAASRLLVALVVLTGLLRNLVP